MTRKPRNRKPAKPAPAQPAPVAQPTPGGHISGEKLCVLTGLTDRQHRNIAKAGFFPPPILGQYQVTATLQGLFKYYRELGERKKHKRDQIDEEKFRKLKLENDETEGRVTDTDRLAKEAAPSIIAIRDILYALVVDSLPSSLCGVDVPTGRIIAKRSAETLLLKWQEVFKRWQS